MFDLDWKPYAFCYRLSFFMAVPGMIFMHFGYGGAIQHGEFQMAAQ